MSYWGPIVGRLSHRYDIDDLTAKQQAFVLAYIEQGCVDQGKAAEKAGYAHPDVEACRLLAHPKITAVLDSVREEAFRRSTATFWEACAVLTRIMRGEIGEPVTDLAGQPTGEVISKPSDRTAAIKQLSKMMDWDSPKRVEVSEPRTIEATIAECENVVRLHRGKEEDHDG